jgi:hypothetical protein
LRVKKSGLAGEEVMAAAVGIETRGQALGREHLQKAPEGRSGAFLLDQERRVERARRVIHGDDEIKLRLARKPSRWRAILVQHHAFARLALALATVRPTPRRTLNQARCMQLRLHPRVAPAEAVIALQMLVEVLHVPAPIGVVV